MEEKEQAQHTEQEDKSISVRSHCNSEVSDDRIEHGTETRSVQLKDAGEGSRVSLLMDEGSLMSEQVESSAKPDRQSHRQPPNEINHDDRRSRSRYKHKHHSEDNCDSDLHQHDSDNDSYRRRRSSLDERKRCY